MAQERQGTGKGGLRDLIIAFSVLSGIYTLHSIVTSQRQTALEQQKHRDIMNRLARIEKGLQGRAG